MRKFDRETPVLESLFNKLLHEKETPTPVFSYEISEILRKPFLQSTSGGSSEFFRTDVSQNTPDYSKMAAVAVRD